jgi:uncharacterized protein
MTTDTLTGEYTVDLDLDLNVREEPQDGYLTTIYGKAIPYGEAANVPGEKFGLPGRVNEVLEREAFDPKDVVGKPLAWRHNEPIGIITAAHNEPDGLYITAGILDTVAGRDADTLLRSGAVKGLSAGFMSAKPLYDKARNLVKHVAASMIETSLTHQGAYRTAAVASYREKESTMTRTITVPETADVPAVDVHAREVIADLRTQIDTLKASIDVTGSDVHPLAHFRDAKEYFKAVVTGDIEERTLNVSALSEQTGLIPPTWLTKVAGVMDRGRPTINSVGGPSSAGDSGIDIKWPISAGPSSSAVATTGSDAGTEVASADHDITVGTASLVQYAGANRLTYMNLDRSSPEYLAKYLAYMVGSYNKVTETAFATALWANDTSGGTDYAYGSDTTGSGLIAAVWQAATACEYATGAPAEVVMVAKNIWDLLPTWSKFQEQNYPVQNVAGVYNIRGLSANIGGLPVVLARDFAVDGSQDAIVTNSEAIGWAEEGPKFAANEAAGSAGRDVAIYGYAVATPYVPAGIVSIYNTP